MPKPTKAPATATKKPVSHAEAPQPPRIVSADSMAIDRGLHRTSADRSTLRSPLDVTNRLAALLWSWPIHRAICADHPKPVWPSKGDDKEIRERKETAQTLFSKLAETWYSGMEYPDITYGTWPPMDSSRQIGDVDCKHLGDQLRAAGIMRPDKSDDRKWIFTLLEHGWGDEQDGRGENFTYRQGLQKDVLTGLDDQKKLQVCEIGERARDDAYRYVRDERSLREFRQVKKKAASFKLWLMKVTEHAPFVDENLADIGRGPDPGTSSLPAALAAFCDAFRVVKAHRNRVSAFLKVYMQDVVEDTGRDHHASAGRPRSGAWVKTAGHDLKSLHLSEPKRRDLLIAWGLIRPNS